MFDALTARPARRRWRTLVLIGSLAAHAVAGIGLMIAAMWKIELLLPERQAIEIGGSGHPSPPPEAPAPATPQKKPRAARKRPPPVPVQPTPPQLEPVPVSTDTGQVASTATGPMTGGEVGPGGGEGPGCATPPCSAEPTVVAPTIVCGDGTRAGDEACDDGNTRNGDGCSSSCRVETRQLAAHVIDSLRLSGESRILPPSMVQTQMARDGVNLAVGVFRVCLDAAGNVASVTLRRPTGYDDYDQRLAAGIRQWRYRPYQVNGQAVPACGTVQFVYQQR